MLTVLDILKELSIQSDSNIAIEAGDIKLSYSDINMISDNIAGVLLNHYDLKYGDIIGVQAGKSHLTILLIIGILKANMVFVMIDEEHPFPRRKYLIEDSGCRLLILINGVAEFGNTIYASDILGMESTYLIPPKQHSPADLAYIVYTSGTTGVPKGAMITHAGLLNMAVEQSRLYRINTDDRVLQLASLSFDAAIAEIFETFVSSATLVIPPAGINKDVNIFGAYLAENKISMITVTPTFLKSINPSIIKSITKLLVVGEPLPAFLVWKYFDKINLYNSYGVSECSICSTVYEFTSNFNGIVKIGKPINGVKIMLVDENFEVIEEKGEIGEMYIGGIGVATGYINNPKLTNDKFVYLQNESGVFYKTGDKAYQDGLGEYVFIGRLDEQIKIRGFRIEPSEVENVINDIEGIDCSIVSMVEKGNRELLVAFIQSECLFDVLQINFHISKFLPPYMKISDILIVQKFPLTVGGKLDKSALVDKYLSQSKNELILAENYIHSTLKKIIKKVFNVSVVSPFDDLFNDYGCDSLTSLLFMIEIQEQFDRIISIEDIYKFSNIGHLSKYLERTSKSYKTFDTNVILEHKLKFKLDYDSYKGCLIIGATGLIGSHILKELLRLGCKCYCLIRADSTEAAHKKLLIALKHHDIKLSQQDINNIIVLKGNITHVNLGLSTVDLGIIRTNINVVYNCSGYVDHVASYSQLKEINVNSIENILKVLDFFQIKTKLVHLSSCAIFLSSTPLDNSNNEVIEHSTLLFDDSVASGYSISKFNAELALQNHKNINITYEVFRLDLVLTSQHSRTASTQWIDLLIEICLKTGFIFRDDLGITISPQYPSKIAESIVKLSISNTFQSVFHTFPSERYTIYEFLKIMTNETKVTEVSLKEWILNIQKLYQIPNRETIFLINILLDMKFKKQSSIHTFDSKLTCGILNELEFNYNNIETLK
jgi:amino acid adenylation domain-containing protein